MGDRALVIPSKRIWFFIMRNNFLHLAIFLVAFLFLYPVSLVHGQFTCEYSEQDAIADTLNPNGYLALEVGNQWDRR